MTAKNGFDGLSIAASCILGGMFGMMAPGKGKVTFELGTSKPQDWATDALLELVAAKKLSVERFNKWGGLVFTPLIECRPAFVWMMRGGDKTPEAKRAVTEPLTSVQEGQRYADDFLRRVA